MNGAQFAAIGNIQDADLLAGITQTDQGLDRSRPAQQPKRQNGRADDNGPGPKIKIISRAQEEPLASYFFSTQFME